MAEGKENGKGKEKIRTKIIMTRSGVAVPYLSERVEALEEAEKKRNPGYKVPETLGQVSKK